MKFAIQLIDIWSDNRFYVRCVLDSFIQFRHLMCGMELLDLEFFMYAQVQTKNSRVIESSTI
jgi:hypothetical protein